MYAIEYDFNSNLHMLSTILGLNKKKMINI